MQMTLRPGYCATSMAAAALMRPACYTTSVAALTVRMQANDERQRNVERLNALYEASTSADNEAAPQSPPWSKLLGWEGNLRDFDVGISAMRSGAYRDAVASFKRATVVAPGGAERRLGGHYTVWLAQALHAAGQEAEALALLRRCEAHADADVRRIASDVRAIFEAPMPELDAGEFISIPPTMTPEGGWTRPAAEERKPREPERYSLDWYAQRGRGSTVQQRVVEAGGVAGSTAKDRTGGLLPRLALLFVVLVVADPVVWYLALKG
mmetsp:Transcript_12669/g.33689  ORF Transcript_12669/g.33689 Transcript_12669/m.33689 type:complete len:267 (+) Transcript_12669:32-832(+)